MLRRQEAGTEEDLMDSEEVEAGQAQGKRKMSGQDTMSPCRIGYLCVGFLSSEEPDFWCMSTASCVTS